MSERDRYRKLVGLYLGGMSPDVPDPLPVIDWRMLRGAGPQGDLAARGRQGGLFGWAVDPPVGGIADNLAVGQIPGQGNSVVIAGTALTAMDPNRSFDPGLYRVWGGAASTGFTTAQHGELRFFPQGANATVVFDGESLAMDLYLGALTTAFYQPFDAVLYLPVEWSACLVARGTWPDTANFDLSVNVEMLCGVDQMRPTPF